MASIPKTKDLSFLSALMEARSWPHAQTVDPTRGEKRERKMIAS